MDICAFCSKPASMECVRCGESYCGQVCQKAHWKSHRAVCVPMPTLVQSVKPTADVAPPEDTKEIIEIFLSDDELTDTKQSIELSTTMEKVQKVEKPAAKAQHRNDEPTIMPPGVCPDLTAGPIVQTEKAAPLSDEWCNAHTLEDNQPTKIRILNKFRYNRCPLWVSLESMQSRLGELLSEMNRGASDSQPPAKIEQDGLYIVHVDYNWHRAVALGTPRDNFVLVRFIDRGITKLVPMGDIREAWPALYEERAFAFMVVLLGSISWILKVGYSLTVRLVGQEPQKHLVVHVVNGQQASMPEVIAAFGLNEIDLNVINFLGKDRALVSLRRVPSALLDVFMKLHVEAPDLPAWSKKSQLVVITHKEYGWCRARVLSSSGEVMIIFLLDFGVIEPLELPATVKDCPEEFAWLPALTMRLDVESVATDEEDFYDKFRVGGQLRFQLMLHGYSGSVFEGTLCFEDVFIGQATISSFDADLEENNLGWWQQYPQNGTIVQILGVVWDGDDQVIICPADRVGRFEPIVQSIYNHEQDTAIPSDILDKVAVYKYKNAVRRLFIMEFIAENIVSTIDIDSGKSRQLKIKRLFRMPSALCHLPIDTLNVRLTDMPQSTPTCKLCDSYPDTYFAPFIKQKTPFRLVCDGDYQIGGVKLLHLSSGNSVMHDFVSFCPCPPRKRCRLMSPESSSEELSTSDD